MPFSRALQIAKDSGLDLVEVAATAVPPVCRIMDYGKFKFEQTKKEREARRGRKLVVLRELRLRPRIDEHDLASKIKLIERLLGEGDKVRVTVFFRGREVTRPELGKKVLQHVLTELRGKAVVDQPLMVDEKSLSLVFSAPKVPKKMTPEVSSAKDENT